MDKKIVIGGGSGFVGSYCAPRFREMGYRVIIISRSADESHDVIAWDNPDALVSAINGADMVINLAGKSVDCRYTEKNKAEILSSRVDSTRAIGDAVSRADNPPPLWINASTATIYREAYDRPMTEENGEMGEGFSEDVAKAWEAALFEKDLPDTRRVAMRIAIALGNGAGMMPPSKMLVRFGLGGKQASGKQMFSWIHIEDLYRAILFIREHEELNGPINMVSPNPVTNEVFMRTLREKMGMKIGLPAMKWMLELGGFIIGTEAELLLKSRWVIPEKLTRAGFGFTYARIDEALEELVSSK